MTCVSITSFDALSFELINYSTPNVPPSQSHAVTLPTPMKLREREIHRYILAKIKFVVNIIIVYTIFRFLI